MPCGFQDVHLEIRSTTEALDLIQAITEHIARRLGFGEDDLHWMKMAVHESVVNAIRHGNKSDPGNRVFIDFTIPSPADPAGLVVRVRDQGTGFDPGLVRDPLTPENMLQGSGRGIFLIRHFMDDVSIARAPDGGTEVRMLKRIAAQ